jgi:hypothetical protein
MEGITIEKPTLRIINAQENKTIEEWESLYPETWLFIEVTREDLWEVYEGKLVATAADPMEFVEIGQDYRKRQIVNLTTRSVPTAPQSAGVPTFGIIE